MRPALILFLTFLLGAASACYAADDEKNSRLDALSSIQLGDYILSFDGENPRKYSALKDAPALKNLEKDTWSPFIGLKLSRPLKGDLFKFGPDR
ncbi:MAG TPA: hypothetical protein VMT22_03365 [Terriglobales bacterium]|nr:hypothetical protein [Terriglobales bacterium]